MLNEYLAANNGGARITAEVAKAAMAEADRYLEEFGVDPIHDIGAIFNFVRGVFVSFP